jgi:hypothetical protein
VGLLSCERVKLFSDGSLGAETAALRRPYVGSDNRGMLILPPEELASKVASAHAAGFQLEVGGLKSGFPVPRRTLIDAYPPPPPLSKGACDRRPGLGGGAGRLPSGGSGARAKAHHYPLPGAARDHRVPGGLALMTQRLDR